MLTLTDPTLNTTSWSYDSHNRHLTDTNALGHPRSFVYDANGNLTHETDPNGRVMTLSYDNFNRGLEEYSINSTTRALGHDGISTNQQGPRFSRVSRDSDKTGLILPS